MKNVPEVENVKNAFLSKKIIEKHRKRFYIYVLHNNEVGL